MEQAAQGEDMKFPIRLDEATKTPAQIAQRESTYEAAAVLRNAGFACEVVEYFTGTDGNADAAGIRIQAKARP